MYKTPLRSDELYHHGIKGMHWGIRRYQNKDGTLTPEGRRRADNRERKTLKRHVAADKKNLKLQALAMESAQDSYNASNRKYEKELSRPTLFKRKKAERLSALSDEAHRYGKEFEKRASEFERADRIYKEDAKKYESKVKTMRKQYGSEKIADIQRKDLVYGHTLCRDMISTGITVADIPIIGSYYSGAYTGGRMAQERTRNLKRKAQKHY